MQYNLPDRIETLHDRVVVSLLTDFSKEMQDLAREKAKNDPAWFINAFCFTFDPREDIEVHDIPFILWDVQEELIEWLESRIDTESPSSGLVDKSRDMGVTYVICAWLVQKWIFEPGFIALLGSREEKLLDNRTTESLFGILDYLIERLPSWLLPPGFSFEKHRRQFRLSNPDNGNHLVGQLQGPNFGRGGRYRCIFMDEGASWSDLESAWRSAGGATRSRIIVSTPQGMNFFGVLRWETKIPRLTMHWSQDPRRDQAWYDSLPDQGYTAEDIAQEFDISYQRSVRGIVYPGWHDVPKEPYEFEPKWPIYISWDFGFTDETSLIWWQQDPVTGRYRALDCYENNGKPIDFYVPIATGILPSDWPYDYTSEERKKISIHNIWKCTSAIHYGDPAGDQKTLVIGKSVIDVLRDFDIHVVTNNAARDFKSRKTATELGLRDLEVNIPDSAGPIGCWKLNQSMQNYAFPRQRRDTQSTSGITKPVHNWASHLATAVEYFFVNVPPKHKRKLPASKRRQMAYEKL